MRRERRALGIRHARIDRERCAFATLDEFDGGVGVELAQRAAGGPVSANTPYVVGEVGPELFVPGASGNIIPAGKTAAMMSGGGSGGATINITVNAGLGTDGVALGRVLVKAIKDAEGRDGIGWRS